ncbi:DUF91 domain-containing protein [Halobacteriales archaeon Cl-PHB]
MAARTHVIAGRCTTSFEDNGETTVQRGDVVVVCKPDDTVLVHDARGYQPVAWLTRADGLAVEADAITAWDGDQRLEVTVHDRYGGGQYPTGAAGLPVGECPDCDATLLRSGAAVTCPDCAARYGIPSDAAVLADACEDCGLPTIRVERGEPIEVCVDRHCESLDERVADAFDREWTCPDCGDDLRVLNKGGLLLGCASYPACDASFSFPSGTVAGSCDCGLPVFATRSGDRCLDATCDAMRAD